MLLSPLRLAAGAALLATTALGGPAGAAEALSVKITRQVKGRDLTPEAALEGCLLEYQAPVSEDIMRFQIALAAAEATEKTFVPESFRSGSGITG